MPKKYLTKIILWLLIIWGISACSVFEYKNYHSDGIVNDNTDKYSADNPAGIDINGNLWDDMQDYLQLPDYSDRPEVQEQIKWFRIHQAYLNRVIERSAPYIYYIFAQTRKRGLPGELALIPIKESAYNPFGYSIVGANGLWQIMPGTASGQGIKINWWYDGRRDIIASTNAALDHFAYLHDFFNNWLFAIAAYNAGEGTIQAAIARNKKLKEPTDFWSLKLPTETEIYIPRVLALAAIIRDPDRYNIHLVPINDAPYLTAVDVGSQIDLAQAAKLAGISVATIHKLNPGFRRWATDPNGPYVLLIPAAKAKGFKQRLEALPKDQRVTWQEHTVQPGDSLLAIAYKYKTNVRIIKQVNHLKTDLIKPKQHLLIPSSFHGSLKSPVVKEYATITEEKIPGPHRVVHIVSNGDTLWTVAEKYGVSVRELRFWNKIASKQALTPNQKLLIWAPSHSRLVHIHTYSYKVTKGDSLDVIARRFGSTVKKIKRANHLKNNTIRIGQVLKIPGTIHHAQMNTNKSVHITIPKNTHYLVHTVKPGDNLKLIAHYNNTTVEKLQAWNHLENEKYIKPGQKIYIYYEDKK